MMQISYKDLFRFKTLERDDEWRKFLDWAERGFEEDNRYIPGESLSSKIARVKERVDYLHKLDEHLVALSQLVAEEEE